MKEYFSQLRVLERRISAMKVMIAEYARMGSSPSSPNYGVRVNHGIKNDAGFVYWALKQAEAERQLQELEIQLAEKRQEVLVLIGTLDNEEYQSLLAMRYLDGMQWKDIAERLNLSEPTIYRWHNEALKKLIVNDS